MWTKVLCFLLVVDATFCSQNGVSWNELFNENEEIRNTVRRHFEPHWFKSISSSNVSEGCYESLKYFVQSFEEWSQWALEMADASGRSFSGFLSGNSLDYGNFEQCRLLQVMQNGSEKFRGKYCMIGYKSELFEPLFDVTPSGKSYIENYGQPPAWISHMLEMKGGFLRNSSFWIATCFPSTCIDEDVLRVFSAAVPESWKLKVHISDCQVEGDAILPPYAIACWCAIAIIMLLVIVGSLIKQKKGLFFRILKAFSWYKNYAKLSPSKGKVGRVGCFHGIRCLSSLFVIACHCFIYPDTWKTERYSNINRIANYTVEALLIESAPLVITNYYMISGFLLVYTLWNRIKKDNGKIDFLRFMIRKYFRLIPPFLLSLAMFLIAPSLYNGPTWRTNWEPEIQNCLNSWWRNLLFINNWWPVDNQCMIHTWFIANLMQLNLLGILVLLCAYRFPKTTVGSVVLVTIGCMFHDFYRTLELNIFKMPAVTVCMDKDLFKTYVSEIYMRPTHHLGTFCMGMAIGYFVLNNKDYKLSKMQKCVGWTIAIIFFFAVASSIYLPPINVKVVAAYITFHRYIWGVSIGWAIYACTSGFGGDLNAFLSAKVFIPMSSVSYLAYLLHVMFYLYRFGSATERYFMGQLEHSYDLLAIFLLSYFFGFLGYVMVEEPFVNLEAIIMKKKQAIPIKNKDGAPNEKLQNEKFTTEILLNSVNGNCEAN